MGGNSAISQERKRRMAYYHSRYVCHVCETLRKIYIKALSCELDKTWDQEIVDHINMMIIHNIHGIIRITITTEVHMIQTSSLFLQYHEVKGTCCLATVHQKCVGLASTGVCASLKHKYNQHTNSSLGDQIW